MRPKVRLLLDVDGVLNAVTDSPGKFWSDWQVDEVYGFNITWSPSVIAFVQTLHERGVEIHWLTTWGEKANEYLCDVLGLPNFPVAGESLDYIEAGWWKLPLAQELYERDLVPFVWIDDDLSYDIPTRQWLDTLPHGSSLAICPGTIEGIHPRHIEKITAFVETHLREYR